MEFLKIYDVTEKIKQMEMDGDLICQIEDHILKYMIQEDVHDFHVFRVIKGTYDEQYEGREDEVFTVEHQNIDKYDVMEKIGTKRAINNRQERDKWIKTKTDRQLIAAIIELDDEDGMSNWDYKVTESIDDAMNLITEEHYELV